VGRSKPAARVEQKLGVATSGRNWRTVLALLNMAQDTDEGAGRLIAAGDIPFAAYEK